MRSGRGLLFIVMLSAVLGILPGCNLARISQDIGMLEQAAELRGEVKGAAKDRPVAVVLVRDVEGKREIFNYSVRYGSGSFRFGMTPGTAYLFAFEDRNENLRYEKGEPAGWYGGSKPEKITLKEGEKADNLVITLSTAVPEGVDDVTRPERPTENARKLGQIMYAVGEVTSLDDARFTAEKGKQGLFEPIHSASENGLGIYMLEAYDPKKVPVLFVHGAGGYPREFKSIIEKLDRKKFQPWVFQYQSGLRLDMSSDVMVRAIVELYARDKFDSLVVVAHSMGGLVSRAAINKIVSQYPRHPVKLFITLATPWDGVDTAKMGVEHSPLVVQSWIDVAPGSPFLVSLFEQPLPKAVSYYLLFGVVGGKGTDGAVPLTSVTSLRAQADAIRIYAYPETHSGILRSDEAVKRVNQLLEQAAL